MPLRDGEAWNDEDLAKRRQLARSGQPIAEIACALERAPTAVAARAKRMQLAIKGRPAGQGRRLIGRCPAGATG